MHPGITGTAPEPPTAQVALRPPRLRGAGPHAGFDRGLRALLRRYRLVASIILALAAANLFVRLDDDAVESFDEARYGVAAYEMLRDHSWVVTTYAGQPDYWNLKPVLGYWGMAASFAVFGPTRFALRFTSAASALVAIALTMRFARRRFSRGVALLAGLVLATSFPFIDRHSGRNGDLDAQIALITTATFVLVEAARSARVRAIGASSLIGLGFLVKGVAIMPSIAIIVGQHLLGSRARLRTWAMASVIPVGLVAAWVAARVVGEGSWRFVTAMVHEDLIQRGFEGVDGRPYDAGFYAHLLLDRFWPWPVVALALPVMVWLARRGRGPRLLATGVDRHVAAVWLWAAVPFVLFSIMRTQCRWYMNPVYPPLAVLSALAAIVAWRHRPTRAVAAALIIVFVVGCGVGEARIIKQIREDNAPNPQDALVRFARDRRWHARRIYTTDALEYAERFILEVMGGMDVHEQQRPPAGELLLVRSRGGDAEAEVDRGEILVRDGRYQLRRAPGTDERAR